ncbi:MAG: hypothetical protein WC717_02565 [Candidatus Micrarchaeia archaeon]
MGTGIGQREYNGPVNRDDGKVGQKGYPKPLPGLGVGQREYHGPEGPLPNLRSLSRKRAQIAMQYKANPVSKSDIDKAMAAIEKTRRKIISYNDKEFELQKRVKGGKPAHLAGNLQRLFNREEEAKRKMEEQLQHHSMLAKAHYEWQEVRPMLDEQIAQARQRRKGAQW